MLAAREVTMIPRSPERGTITGTETRQGRAWGWLSPLPHPLCLLRTLGSDPGWHCGLAGYSPNKPSHSLSRLIDSSLYLLPTCPGTTATLGPLALQCILLILSSIA